MGSQKSRANKIIQQIYDPKEQSLNFTKSGERRNYWFSALQNRDWTMLKELNLYDCGINDDTIYKLVNINWLNLANLDLGWNYFTHKGMQLMANCKIKNIKSLQLSGNLIGNIGIKYLVKMDLPILQMLYIGQCQIQNQGFKHLTKGSWPNLSQICLEYSSQHDNENKIQLRGWETIGQNNFKQLKTLFFYQSSPICLINCVLIEKSTTFIYHHANGTQNQVLKQLINGILNSRSKYRLE